MKDKQELSLPLDQNHNQDSVQCKTCMESRPSGECWWCRDCAISLCPRCHLMKGHTEHQCFPWSKQELAKSAIRALQQRCQMRINHAAEQEISIREYMAEVEAFFLAKLQERLRDLNERDRTRIASLVEAAELDKTYLTSTPTTPGPPNRPLARNLDARIERNLDEIAVAFSGNDEIDGFNMARTPPTRPKGFAAVLPEMPVEEFARLLEAKLQTHFLAEGDANEDYVSSKSGASSRAELSGNLSVFSPKPVDASTPKSTQIRPFPIEPQVQVINGTHKRVSSVSESSMTNGPVVFRNNIDNSSPAPVVTKLNLSAPPAGGDGQVQPQPPRTSRSISEQSPRQYRTQSVDRKSIENRKLVESDTARSADYSGYKLTTSGSEKTSPMTPQDDNVSTGGRSVDSRTSRIALTGYHFGEDYLTKPLDVCVLPENRLAISDSCGGVYFTDREGEVINRLLIEEASASSLSYNEIRKELFVSLMLQERRIVRIYLGTAEDFSLTENIPCPTDPEIDITRTRWLASLRNGDLYVVSGDNEISAIWKYNRMMRRWMTIRHAKGTRYQYACVIEDHPEKYTTVLMTCDGVQGRLLMFFIASGSAKIMKEYNMTQEWNLLPSVKNPASAIYDEHSNVLVLDYAAGKLWMVSASRGGAPPSIKVVADVGAQNAVGLTVTQDGWCFIACFGRRRVQAIKYLDL